MDVPKTQECWWCGARGDGMKDATLKGRPRVRCIDSEACDRRASQHSARARLFPYYWYRDNDYRKRYLFRKDGVNGFELIPFFAEGDV